MYSARRFAPVPSPGKSRGHAVIRAGFVEFLDRRLRVQAFVEHRDGLVVLIAPERAEVDLVHVRVLGHDDFFGVCRVEDFGGHGGQ